MTAPGLELIYRCMYSTISQLSNQTSADVARRAEAFPTHRVGLHLASAVRREAILAEKHEGPGSAKGSGKVQQRLCCLHQPRGCSTGGRQGQRLLTKSKPMSIY